MGDTRINEPAEQQVQPEQFATRLFENLAADRLFTARPDTTASNANEILPRVSITQPGERASDQLVLSPDGRTAQHGGVRYEIEPPVLPAAPGDFGRIRVAGATGDGSWMRLTRPPSASEGIAFSRGGVGGANPTITLLQDGRTQAVSSDGNTRTVRNLDGSRTYFQRPAGTTTGDANVPVAVRDQSGRVTRLDGAQPVTPPVPGQPETFTVRAATLPNGQRVEVPQPPAPNPSNREIRVNARTGQVTVSDQPPGATERRPLATLRSDGSREFGTLPAADTAAGTDRNGFRLTTGGTAPGDSTLHTRIPGATPGSFQTWNVSRDTEGRITRVQRPGGDITVNPAAGESIRFDAQGNLVRRASSGTTETFTPQGHTLARDNQGRVTGMQFRKPDGTMAPVQINRSTDGTSIANLTLPGTPPVRLDSTPTRPITIDASGNITQPGTEANRSTVYRPDGTRVERSGTGATATETTFNAYRDGQATSIRTGDRVMNLEYNPPTSNTISRVTDGSGRELARVGQGTPPVESITRNPAGQIVVREGTGAAARDRILTPGGAAGTGVIMDPTDPTRVREVIRPRPGTPTAVPAGTTDRYEVVRNTTGQITGLKLNGADVQNIVPNSVQVAPNGRVTYDQRVPGTAAVPEVPAAPGRPAVPGRPATPDSTTRHTLDANGGSVETRLNGQRTEGSGAEHGITRDQHGRVTRQEFYRADGRTRGERIFTYRNNPDGSPAMEPGSSPPRPIVERIQFQLPHPASLVRASEGPPALYRVQADSPQMQEMLNRLPADHPLKRGFDPQIQINPTTGDLSFRWHDGRRCDRPADARRDQTEPQRTTPPGGTPERTTPPGPPALADAGGPDSPLARARARARQALELQQRGRRTSVPTVTV